MKKESGDFYALLFQMKNIVRWGLMYNTRPENLSEHAAECAILAHALALIGNEKFGKKYDPLRLLAAGLYHDMNEVLTGDLPTPVKYYNEDIRRSYKEIEAVSEEKMLSLLTPSARAEYKKLLDLTPEEKKLVKGADKLCAYIKCLSELQRGNKEFASARRVNEKSLREFGSEEVDYFMEHLLPSFTKNIDEVSL
ncbi:MAG: 5'-deoxynucleotidase [Clostridia bacterium]|nr:5'-deoxynucleotidase [Clostridia bacterium]